MDEEGRHDFKDVCKALVESYWVHQQFVELVEKCIETYMMDEALDPVRERFLAIMGNGGIKWEESGIDKIRPQDSFKEGKVLIRPRLPIRCGDHIQGRVYVLLKDLNRFVSQDKELQREFERLAKKVYND